MGIQEEHVCSSRAWVDVMIQLLPALGGLSSDLVVVSAVSASLEPQPSWDSSVVIQAVFLLFFHSLQDLLRLWFLTTLSTFVGQSSVLYLCLYVFVLLYLSLHCSCRQDRTK